MAHSDGDELVEIGNVGAPHGLRGEIVVRLTSDRPERREPGQRWLVGDSWREVDTSRPHKGHLLVRFAGLATREAVEPLRTLMVRAEPIADDEVFWVDDLIGRTVVDADGVAHGTVTSVVDNPAADLLELDDGRLVPVTFLVDLDGTDRITVDVPEGLWDL